MLNNSWQKFTKRIPINASTDRIYLAWAKASELEKWFLRKADFFSDSKDLRQKNELIQKGDTYKWFWYGYTDEVFEAKKVLQANGKDLIQFTFSGDCIVTVNIKVESGENMVELSQEHIPLEENPEKNLYVACGEGWTFYLANLKSVLEGGIDLRNKNDTISRVISS